MAELIEPGSVQTNQVLSPAEIADTRNAALFLAARLTIDKAITWADYSTLVAAIVEPQTDVQQTYFHAVSAIVTAVKMASGG